MNNKFLSLAAAAATMLAFAACNKDDVQNQNIITADKTTGYAMVSLSFPSVSGTRATSTPNTGSGSYDEGSSAEQAIKNISLGLYDDAGRFVGYGIQETEAPITPPSHSDKTGNVSDQDKMVFKLSLTEGAVMPTKVVAFINTALNTSDLDVLTTNGKVTVDAIGDITNNGLAMTNSGYFDDSKYVVAADLEGDFYNTAAAAAAATDANAEIFVERLAAKITVANKKNAEGKDDINQTEKNYTIKDIDGREITLTYEPKSWSATGTAKSENLVKAEFTNSEPTWMNNFTDYRSFWAEGVNYSLDFAKYYDSSTKRTATSNPLNYVNYAEVEDASSLTDMGTAEYVPEHTTSLQLSKGEENIIANTYALVLGNYTVSYKETVTDGFTYQKNEEIDFYLLLTGIDTKTGHKTYTIYNEDQLVKYLLSLNNLEKVRLSSDGEMVDASTYFEIFYNKEEGKYALQRKSTSSDTDLYKEDKTKVSKNDYAKTTNSKHYYYPEGAAYFNVPILHNKTTDGVETYGVVRNHSYVLTITKIENLGAPLDDNGHDENDPIIPDPDELKDHFIKAEINVLSWHAINNNVTL